MMTRGKHDCLIQIWARMARSSESSSTSFFFFILFILFILIFFLTSSDDSFLFPAYGLFLLTLLFNVSILHRLLFNRRVVVQLDDSECSAPFSLDSVGVNQVRILFIYFRYSLWNQLSFLSSSCYLLCHCSLYSTLPSLPHYCFLWSTLSTTHTHTHTHMHTPTHTGA